MIDIKYHKTDNDDVEIRTIIPTIIPDDFISAIEVTGLNESEIDNISILRDQYHDYVKQYKSNMFTFAKYLDHMNIPDPNIKYKRFKLDKIEYL